MEHLAEESGAGAPADVGTTQGGAAADERTAATARDRRASAGSESDVLRRRPPLGRQEEVEEARHWRRVTKLKAKLAKNWPLHLEPRQFQRDFDPDLQRTTKAADFDAA